MFLMITLRLFSEDIFVESIKYLINHQVVIITDNYQFCCYEGTIERIDDNVLILKDVTSRANISPRMFIKMNHIVSVSEK